MYAELEAVIREAFASAAAVPFQERPTIPEDLEGGVFIASLDVSHDWDEGELMLGARPDDVSATLTLGWFCRHQDIAAAEEEIDTAFFSAAELAAGRLGPDIAGAHRLSREILPIAAESFMIYGQDIWLFGR